MKNAIKRYLKAGKGFLVVVGVITFLFSVAYFGQKDADEKTQIRAHAMDEGIQNYTLIGKESTGFFPLNHFTFVFVSADGQHFTAGVSRQNYAAFSIGESVPCVEMSGTLVPVRSSVSQGLIAWDNTNISTLNRDGSVNSAAASIARALWGENYELPW